MSPIAGLDTIIPTRIRLVFCLARSDETDGLFPLSWLTDWILTASGTRAKVLLFDYGVSVGLMSSRYGSSRREGIPPPHGCGSIPAERNEWGRLVEAMIEQYEEPMVICISVCVGETDSLMEWLADAEVTAGMESAGVRCTYVCPFVAPLDFLLRVAPVVDRVRWGVDYLLLNPFYPVSISRRIDEMIEELNDVYHSHEVVVPPLPEEYERHIEEAGGASSTVYDALMDEGDPRLSGRMGVVWGTLCSGFERARAVILPTGC